MSSPWIAICIWKQKHTSSESVYPQSLRLICLHHVVVCFPGVYLLKIPSCTQAWRAWIPSTHLVLSFEHNCADPTSHLPRFGVTSVPCCPAYSVTIEQICWAHFRMGNWPNAYTQKTCPGYAIRVASGDGICSWFRKQLVCPTVRWTVDGGWVSQRQWQIGTGGQSSQSQPSLCEMTSSDLSTQVCKRDNWSIFKSVRNQTDLMETWKTKRPSRLCGCLTSVRRDLWVQITKFWMSAIHYYF